MVLGNMTLAVSDELQNRMGKHREIRWSEIAREAFEKRLTELEWMDKITKQSRLTEKDAEEIGHKIKTEIWKRFKKRFSI